MGGPGEQHGTDGGKLIKGRKRHIVVDTMGLLLGVVVTAANVDVAKGAKTVLSQLAAQDLMMSQTQWKVALATPAEIEVNRPWLDPQATGLGTARPGPP